MNMQEKIIQREKDALFQTYKRLKIVVDRAEGCRVYDSEGNSYLDFLSGIAVNALGHSHPKVVEAVCGQASKYMHLSNYFYQVPQISLAEKLESMSGFDRTFFSNSGSEAMEGAIKLARRWGSSRNKKDIYAFSGGFHGRTYGALSIMDKPQYKDGMGPFLDNTRVLPYNDADSLKKHINAETCAVVLEFVQGEGGLRTVNKEFIEELSRLKEQFNFLVVADEIQAGIGRTGKFFAFEHFNIQPDIITCAKALGGGLPLGAILAKESLADVWKQGMHGTTYGGNAVACAAGQVVLDELDNGLMNHVVETGNYFISKLQEIKKKYPSLVKEVRGLGLMLGLELTFEGAQLLQLLFENFVISNVCSGNILRIVPPLIITKADIDEFITKLDLCLGKI